MSFNFLSIFRLWMFGLKATPNTELSYGVRMLRCVAPVIRFGDTIVVSRVRSVITSDV